MTKQSSRPRRRTRSLRRTWLSFSTRRTPPEAQSGASQGGCLRSKQTGHGPLIVAHASLAASLPSELSLLLMPRVHGLIALRLRVRVRCRVPSSGCVWVTVSMESCCPCRGDPPLCDVTVYRTWTGTVLATHASLASGCARVHGCS